ncbi:hypothetical protein BDY19DRAFT_914262 [Irpex rosettiformis]|uniref:Uncharacterized protein n=1 Tax=Irpex rosettiformis TaxID=378272 RepID=A0ACB8UK24_9APHY|nr:hypothetical protein BDY19DRAFT_914262 [Irpex rosettiformis]
MGFCRRCGDIVFGARCKCGGSAVAPVVNWTVGEDDSKQDRWSKTYVTNQETGTTTVQPAFTGSSSAPKRFLRPSSSVNATPIALNSQVSAHIRSATSSRSTTPLKYSNTGIGSQSDEAKAQEGILPSPHNSELAKVYGSVLQPKETLSSFTCAICATSFPPDATIYPDPCNVNASGIDTSAGQADTRFLCRPCFTSNGGSRGECESCCRPVLILKSEGGFVENSARVWHKKCFNCDGCGKNIGEQPMVDLLGRPSCTDCFDSCLKRPIRTDALQSPGRGTEDILNNMGGNRRDTVPKEREGSPTLEELQARLGIVRSTPTGSTSTSTARDWKSDASIHNGDRPRSNSMASISYNLYSTAPSWRTTEPLLLHNDVTQIPGSPTTSRPSYRHSLISDVATEHIGGRSRTRSPRTSTAGSTKPTEEAIEEMKRRFLSGNGSPLVSPQKHVSSNASMPRRRSRSRSRPRSSVGGDTTTRGSSAPKRDRESIAVNSDSSDRPLRSSASTSSLRLRPQKTGDTTTDLGLDTDAGLESERDAYKILPDRTGESTQPLRIRRNNTGATITSLLCDHTGSTSRISEHRTGDTEYVTANETGGTYHPPGPQRSGGAVKSHSTGEHITRQHTAEGRIRRQRTGDTEAHVHDTTIPDYCPVRRQRTSEGNIRRERTGEADTSTIRQRDYAVDAVSSDLGLRRDRTGDAEVESLLGAVASLPTGDLIDLSPSPEPTASPSRIPQRVGSRIPTRSGGDYRSSLELGFNMSSSSGSSLTSSGYESSASSIPDLVSDFSDTISTRSTGPSTPPSASPPSKSTSKANGSSKYGSGTGKITPTSRSRAKSLGYGIGLSISDLPRDERCASCMLPLFSVEHGGKYVTVPEEPTSTGAAPKRYHTACFKCKVCDEVFEEKEGGHAVFVRVEEGACHVHCAPPEKITLRKNAASSIPKVSKIPLSTTLTGNSSPPATTRTTAFYSSSSRYEPPPPTAPLTGTFPTTQPRFGGSSVCPGCLKAVSPMERGVVPGPQGSKWHGGCLICGGAEAKGKRKVPGKAGCGKKLDSGAKVGVEGGVWCRECLLLLPPHLRQTSTVKSPVAPISTGNRPFSMVAPQSTGGTTLARQFTGIGGGGSIGSGNGNDYNNDVLRQLTGGGLSPTRQLSSSPTKMHDGPRPGVGRYPRPKSVIGTRSTGSGEGRGMFLVRQLTGGSTSFSGNEYGL